MAKKLANSLDTCIRLISDLDASVQVRRSNAWETIAAFDSYSVARDYAKDCAADTGEAYRTIDLETGKVQEEF